MTFILIFCLCIKTKLIYIYIFKHAKHNIKIISYCNTSFLDEDDPGSSFPADFSDF